MTGLVTRLRRRSSGAPSPALSNAAAPAPAGLEPQTLGADPAPSFRDRGRLRRRLRHLRRVRELGFRDLGGLVFDLHRFGRQGDDLVATKLAALATVDRELRALERALRDERPFHELREAGLAACPRCAAIHGTDARFCPSCGTGLRGPLAVAEVGDAPGEQAAQAVPVAIVAAAPSPTAPEVPAEPPTDEAASPSEAGPAQPSSPVDEQPPDDAPMDDAPTDDEQPPAPEADDITVVQRPGEPEA